MGSSKTKSEPRGPNPVTCALVDSAVARLTRALEAYWKLGDEFADPDGRAPVTRRPALAELAVDVSTGVEALISALRRERRLCAGRDKPIDLLKLALGQPEVDGGLRRGVGRFVASFKHIRDVRNRYLHGGVMPPDSQRTAIAFRDTIELGLRLAATFPLLRQRWNDEAVHNIDESLWRFVGQPDFIANQIRRAFSGRHFRDLRAHLEVDRHGEGGRFFLNGALIIRGEIEQYRWGFTGRHARLLEHPGIHAEIGVVAPPPASQATERGEEIVEGQLEFVACDLTVGFEGFGLADNPLLAPIYLYEGEGSPWCYGPGDVRLAWLKLTIPYRAHTIWYPMPESRLRIRSEFLDCQAEGTASGELHFSHPGHLGKPAFKGSALIQGSVGPISCGLQLADWTLYSFDVNESRGSGMWSGVSRLALRSDLALDIAFSEF